MTAENKIEIETLYFAMVNPANNAVVNSVENLKNALYHRRYFYCEVACLRTIEEANSYVIQKYYNFFYSNPYLSGVAPMPLPQVDNKKTYNLNSNLLTEKIEENNPTKNEVISFNNIGNQNIYNQLYPVYANPAMMKNNIPSHWGIDAMNGYAICSDLNTLCQIMSSSQFIYPHAIACTDIRIASIEARSSYIDRFARRYGFYTESVEVLPILTESGSYFLDSNHNEREARYTENNIIKNLVSCGLL